MISRQRHDARLLSSSDALRIEAAAWKIIKTGAAVPSRRLMIL